MDFDTTAVKAVRLCSLCKEDHAAVRAATGTGEEISICDRCLESKAKENFVWICLICRKIYLQPKSRVISGVHDPELRRAYLRCLEETMIQGIDGCIECDPERMARPGRAS